MSSMELEVKILNIDKEGIINKIKKAGGKYIKYFIRHIIASKFKMFFILILLSLCNF